MVKKNFLGKIHTDPGEALAKGPREVMATLWRQYLSDALELSPRSRRYQVICREIEQAAGYAGIFKEWNSLGVEARARAWRGLVSAARQRWEETREACVRCGECCEQGSPTLLTPDLALFHQEVLTFADVYTLRAGETATDRAGKAIALKEERLKVREVPGSRQCVFYLAATRSCRIHDHKPEQCRRQNCWGEPPPEPEAAELLGRRDLLAGVPEIWELVSAHEERCGCVRVAQALPELDGVGEEASFALFEALHFDHYLRKMFTEEWGLSPTATEFLLGRPLTGFLRELGVNASLTPEGVFRLARRED